MARYVLKRQDLTVGKGWRRAALVAGIVAGVMGGSYQAYSAMIVHDPTSFVTLVQQLTALSDQVEKMQEQVNEAKKLNGLMGSEGLIALRAVGGLAEQVGRVANSLTVDLENIELPGGENMTDVIVNAGQAKEFISEALYSVEALDVRAGDIADELRASNGMSREEMIADRDRAREARFRLSATLTDSALANGLASKGDARSSAELFSSLSSTASSANTLRAQIAAQNEIQLAVLAELVRLNGLMADKVAMDAARNIESAPSLKLFAKESRDLRELGDR
ncbi:general amidase, putative [Tepidicaulis marinus]|uniref:General amidase, putative n=1 Tax=Tepidicaulis marinus TaxID=1333998 RepID=A0A081BF45_9HYPH|nr:hypothetical protein [Tepidicaulis marinus]GAK46663.1 general amidase, putative [Tepidicaulis marinus]